MTTDDLHNVVIRHLRTPSFINLRLVARLVDDRLANPATNVVQLFIPDSHLVSNAWQPHYSYHFNEAPSFYRMLFRLRDAGSELRSNGCALRAIQLGDLFDLWRDGNTTAPDNIIADNVHLTEMLYSYPDGLLARLVVGNHDLGMAGTANWSFRYLLPNDAAGDFCLALHGDWFDPILHNILPQWLQSFCVMLGGPIPQPETHAIAAMRQAMVVESNQAGQFKDRIQLATSASIGTPMDAAAPLPKEYNVTRANDPNVHPFLAAAVQTVRSVRTAAGGHPAWPTIRLVAIGHTHFARLSLDDSAPGDPIVLLDCGAWIEKYDDGTGIARPNCQIGIVAGNDVRIYQLDPL
jgi:hypothetical protein